MKLLFPMMLAISTITPKATFAAHGYLKTGSDLYQECGQKSILCIGYIEGVLDEAESAYDVYLKSGISADKLFRVCTPDKVRVEDVVDVVLKYLRENPASRQYTASSDVTVALGEAYPCQN